MRQTDTLRGSESGLWVERREIPRGERIKVPLFSLAFIGAMGVASWFFHSSALALATVIAAMLLLPYSLTAIRYGGRPLWSIEITPSKLTYSRVGLADLEIRRDEVVGVRAGGPEPGIGRNNIWLILKDGRQETILGLEREQFAKALEAFQSIWGIRVSRYPG